MKPRARRAVIGAAALVAVLVAALVATHWGTVRDHVEAWHFQATTETETVTPPEDRERDALERWYFNLVTRETKHWPVKFLFQLLAVRSRRPVILDKGVYMDDGPRLRRIEPGVGVPLLSLLQEGGYRVLEQRFPRRAYVVIYDARPVLALPLEEREPPGCYRPAVP